MTKAGIYLLPPKGTLIYDTTLRDGAQAEGVSFSTEDKLDILRRLDSFGIDFVEGGWPGSNPKDNVFFKLACKEELKHTRLTAFGSTMRAESSPEEDINILALLESGADWLTIFGKSWDMQVTSALQTTLKENLRMVEESIRYLKINGKHVIFDAEHFLDGWKKNQAYALSVIDAAVRGGAEFLVLCDTNGGSLPWEVRKAVNEVSSRFELPVGIHAHNDGELAVANSLAAVDAGAVMVQGTINGLGERCGNANLCSIMPNLAIKMGRELKADRLEGLASLSSFIAEVANVIADSKLPYVGKSAFAHKGGVHVSAINRDTRTYEHIDPKLVGNTRRVLISELSGTSSILAKLKEFGIEEEKHNGRSILDHLKQLESEGFQFEGADASFELLVRRFREQHKPHFTIEGFRIVVDVSGDEVRSDASIKVIDPNGDIEHTAADGNGPVNALDRALRKALERFYPVLKYVRLMDYKVRVIDAKDATAARVRVLIRSTDGHDSWTTVGVSTNIIEASLMALIDSIEYILLRNQREGEIQ
ncbi:MAG: citramalate synthase [Methanomassiliicoccales archaeon]|nr:citramalate synthase [Methanomassiliicoccales archaeon]